MEGSAHPADQGQAHAKTAGRVELLAQDLGSVMSWASLSGVQLIGFPRPLSFGISGFQDFCPFRDCFTGCLPVTTGESWQALPLICKEKEPEKKPEEATSVSWRKLGFVFLWEC